MHQNRHWQTEKAINPKLGNNQSKIGNWKFENGHWKFVYSPSLTHGLRRKSIIVRRIGNLELNPSGRSSTPLNKVN